MLWYAMLWIHSYILPLNHVRVIDWDYKMILTGYMHYNFMNLDVNSSKSLTTCGTQKDDELRIRRIERNHQKLFDLYAIRWFDVWVLPTISWRDASVVCMNSAFIYTAKSNESWCKDIK